ncbi:MAG: ExbD/TolR family protein [Crocinitomicaceae bacterium]
MNLGNRNKPKIEGGMSSMTDLIFLMLIFFIIMSTMVNPTLPVDLPTGENAGPSSENTPVEVGIDKDDQYFIDNEKTKFYSLDDLIPVLTSKIAEQPNMNLKISGDREASYEPIFQLIAISKKNGWTPVLSYKN